MLAGWGLPFVHTVHIHSLPRPGGGGGAPAPGAPQDSNLNKIAPDEQQPQRLLEACMGRVITIPIRVHML